MERRNRSLEALRELIYIDSLDAHQKAPSLQRWYTKYLNKDIQQSFDLELSDLKRLSELFYKNIDFLKNYRNEIRINMQGSQDIKKFFS